LGENEKNANQADNEPVLSGERKADTLPHRLSRATIKEAAQGKAVVMFRNAIADPTSDAYRMIEIMCVNELIEAELKTREYDALEVFRARNQAKELEVKTAHLESQNGLAYAQTEKLHLQIQELKDRIAEIKEKVRQAKEARSGGRQFDYDRALEQISTLVGLRGPEEFLDEEQEQQPN
jgi:hypothetical protein